jgi:hypothetical protein
MQAIEVIINNFHVIAGYVLLACFVAYLNYLINSRNRFAAASTKFHSSVLEILMGLYPVPINWPKNGVGIDPILRDAFPRLQIAVAEFRPHIPLFRRKKYDNCWFRYRCSTGREIDQQCYLHYMDFNDQPDPKITFKQNVDALLSFAKKT